MQIPTMAIDRIFVYSNTSFYPEDRITDMLSLIPIRVDPNLFEFAGLTGHKTPFNIFCMCKYYIGNSVN